MIKLSESANFGGVLHKSGEVVSLSPLIENRMIENGYAVKYPEEKPVEIKPTETEVIKPKRGKKNEPKRADKQ